MKATRKLGPLILMITLIGALLSACGSKAEPSTTTAEVESGESTTSTQAESEQSETKRSFAQVMPRILKHPLT